jgi:TonB family protein
MMNKQLRGILLFTAAFALAVSGSSADTLTTPAPIEALDLPIPAASPGAAYPGIEAIDMTEFCRWQSHRQRFYPPRALTRRVQGLVVLDCTLGPDGEFASCQVLHEAPQRFGFADAATRIACQWRVDSSQLAELTSVQALPDGSSIYRREGEGEPWRVRAPISFRIER